MKMRFTNKSLLSIVLSFAMVIGLLSGTVLVKEKAEAAPINRTIKMGTKEVGNGYYSYPKAEIDTDHESEFYQYMTVLVDSGYLTVSNPALNGVKGKGIIYGDSLDVGYTEMKANEKYEAINFNLGNNAARKSVIDAYIQSIHFTTEATKSQKVTVTVTTRSNMELKARTKKSNGDWEWFDVYYFNGHFYGYINTAITGTDYSWNDAYKQAQESDFYGVKGYLATLTTRAEDRFIYDNFGGNNKGWLGATRANYVASTGKYTDVRNVAMPQRVWGTDAASIEKNMKAYEAYLKACRETLVWKWVTGPENGQVFGYQNSACGDGINTTTQGYDDGGFVTYDGVFSNWYNADKVEPNGGVTGGVNQDEAYGYYGEYTYGRWNDHKDNDAKGFYIEFGGCDGDDETLEDAIDGDHFVYTETEDSEDIITDESVYGKVFNPGPFIVNENADGSTSVGTKLIADISRINFIDPEKNTISYQWFIVDDDGNLEPIEEVLVSSDGKITPNPANGKTYTLTDYTFGKTLAVRVTETDPSGKVVGVGTSAPYETGDGIYVINGTVTIKEDSVTEDGELVVKADVSKVRPSGSHDDLEYEWYTVDDEGNPKEKVHGPSDDDTFTIPEELEGEDLIVVVRPKKGSKYEGEIPSDPYHVKEAIDGKPEIIPNGDNVVGTKLTADISGIGPAEANFKENDFDYQWYIVNEDGTLSEIPGATKSSYTLTKNTIDKDIVVSATVKSTNPNYAGKVYSDPYDDRVDEKTEITGKPVIDQVGDMLTAVVDGVGPEEVRDDLDYTWYVDGEEKGKGSTFDASDYPEGSDIYVEVSVPEDNPRYKGSARSDSKSLEKDKTVVGDGQEKIYGQIVIENQTTDDGGKSVHRVGSKLFANIDNVGPEGCHDGLSYQWYVLEVVDGKYQSTPIPGATGKYYALTEDTLNKTIAVMATADGKKYVGSVTSAPYDTTRTNSDIDITDDEKGKKHIFVTPAEDDMKYTVKETSGADPEDMDVFVNRKDGTREKITGNKDYMDDDGYYTVEAGDTLEFVVDSDKDYVVREKQIKDGNTTIVTPDIPDSNIKAELAEDGTITITVDPADKGKKYAVLKKDGDAYVRVYVTKNDKGEYVYDPNGSTLWSSSGEDVVTFTKLPADGTYKIVAIGTNEEEEFGEINPEDIANNGSGGSKDIVGSEVKSGNSNSQDFTDAEKKKADDMLNGSFTNPKDGSIITDVDDYTRDKILDSEKEWNKLTDREKAAVNAKLKELGSKYTYEQLLAMAKQWKIPYFKMNKYMKKGTKSKLKLVKCSGATVITSSSNEKVATINKKGVIKAKKVGKATCTITVVKGNYSNRLEVKVIVKKKFKNASELKKFKGKIKTPTLLLNKKRQVKKSTKVKIYGLAKGSKVTYKSLNKKVVTINKKGKYTAKKKGKALISATVKQNGKKYILYLNVSAYKKAKKAKK